MLALSDFAAGQVVGIVLLVTIAGFAIRDQLAKKGKRDA